MTSSAINHVRRARTHIPYLPLHIFQRGHSHDACFFADEAYLAYIEWLGEDLAATGCHLHAYVLMTNHVHLLLTQPSYCLDFVDLEEEGILQGTLGTDDHGDLYQDDSVQGYCRFLNYVHLSKRSEN